MENMHKAGYRCMAFNPETGERCEVDSEAQFKWFCKNNWAFLLHPNNLEVAGIESTFRDDSPPPTVN